VSRVSLWCTLALLLAGCGSTSKKGDADTERPVCECSARMEEGCSCPHCMSRDSGMEPADCPCAKRDYK